MYSINEQLTNMIVRLNEAVNVCYDAPNNENEGYPYATGYARSANVICIRTISRTATTITGEYVI